MSPTPGPFRPSELSGADGVPGDADIAAAWSMARELEASLTVETIAPSAGFADAVMAAIALEPTPRRAGFLAAFRAHPGLGGLALSVREAWAVAGGGPGRPAGARALALAYVLAVLVVGTSLAGVAAYGTAGALRLLEGERSPSPSILTPALEPSAMPEPSAGPDASVSPEPSEGLEPGDSAEPSESLEPGDSAEPSESAGLPPPRATASPRPSASPKASDDSRQSPSPSPSEDSSPEPSRTPRPSDTPKPSESSG
jgi:hypothetical protein